MAKFATLVDVYKNSVKQYPDNPLFGTKKDGAWSWMNYAEFGKQTEAFRAGLAKLGVQKGDRVASVSNNRPEWAIAAFGTMTLGGSFVPMYEAQTAKDWEFIVKDCEAKVLVVATDAIVEKVRPLLAAIPTLEYVISLDPKTKADDKVKTFAELVATTPDVPVVEVVEKDIAGLIYTSGTTGNPKGVMLSHGNFASNVSAIHEVFPWENTERSLSFLPWAHVFGQTVELYGLFSLGCGMAIAESVEKIIDNLSETTPTLLFSVPRIFNKLYAAVQKQIASKPGFIQSMVKSSLATRKKQRDGEAVGMLDGLVLSLTDKIVFSKVRARFGGKLKYAFSGGAAISKEVAEFIDGIGITVYEGYGLTETSPIVTANWPENRKIGSVGKAIPGVKVKLGEDNELIVSGPNVMQGYYNRKEENEAAFTKDGWFRTGDMANIDADGYVSITGRLKEQYKLENGKYVVPTPLEEQLKLSPYVLNVMVYGDNKPFNIALLVANVDACTKWAEENGVSEKDPEKLLASDKVRELFKAEVESFGAKFKGYEGVKDFALIAEDFTPDNGMLTPSLKVKRRKVIEKYGDMINGLYAKKPAKAKPEATASAE